MSVFGKFVFSCHNTQWFLSGYECWKYQTTQNSLLAMDQTNRWLLSHQNSKAWLHSPRIQQANTKTQLVKQHQSCDNQYLWFKWLCEWSMIGVSQSVSQSVLIYSISSPPLSVNSSVCRFSFRSRTWEYATSSMCPSSVLGVVTTRWASPGTIFPGQNAPLLALEVSQWCGPQLAAELFFQM